MKMQYSRMLTVYGRAINNANRRCSTDEQQTARDELDQPHPEDDVAGVGHGLHEVAER